MISTGKPLIEPNMATINKLLTAVNEFTEGDRSSSWTNCTATTP